jgi:hypothetical protein
MFLCALCLPLQLTVRTQRSPFFVFDKLTDQQDIHDRVALFWKSSETLCRSSQFCSSDKSASLRKKESRIVPKGVCSGVGSAGTAMHDLLQVGYWLRQERMMNSGSLCALW